MDGSYMRSRKTLIALLSLIILTSTFAHISTDFQPLATRSALVKVDLINKDSIEWIGAIGFGSRPQRLPALFDTGSDQSWIASPTCRTVVDDKITPCQTSIEPEKSESFRMYPERGEFQQSYLSGSVSGYSGADIFTIGSLSTGMIPVGIVNRENGASMANSGFSGLIGLAPGSPALQQILDSAVAADPDASRSFSFYLGDDSGRKGELTFGGWDPHRLSGPIHWLPCRPALTAPYWAISDTTIKFQSLQFNDADAIFDSGSSFIIGPTAQVNAILAMAGASSDGSIPCWKVRRLPELVIIIDGVDYKLKPDQYSLRLSLFSCHIAISASPKSFWILGDAFLINFLSIFSAEAPPPPEALGRPKALSKISEDAPAMVRHWIGLASLNPPRTTPEFPYPIWVFSFEFAIILAISGALLISILMLRLLKI